MRTIKKLLAGGLLGVGLIFLLVAAVIIFQKEKTEKDRDALLGGLVLGLPATLAGSWLIWNLQTQQQQDRQLHLQRVFYQLLKDNDGKINVLKFAMESQVSAAIAKQYLDVKAKEFDANFNVVETTVVYEFGLVDFESDT